MKIYVSHSGSFDYKVELYRPLRNSFLNSKHEIILPHENSDESFDSKNLFSSGKCDLVLAEVSFPSTGQGIELGWANINNIRTICIYKTGSKISRSSLKVISKEFIEYNDSDDLKNKVEEYLKNE